MIFTPGTFGAGNNIVGSGSDGDTYWSLFNIEGESVLNAQYATYNSMTDMLLDTNRLNVLTPATFGAGHNIVGSGTDGNAYWSLFNIEGESGLNAQYVTYNALEDMLLDTNRMGVFTPNTFGAGRNIVGSSAFILPSATVPEPGTLGLLMMDFLGLFVTTGRSHLA